MIIPDLLSPEARIGRFDRICEDAMRERREQGTDGIGTLAEKWQHQIIKRYLSEDPAEHEVKLPGTRFVSDIRCGDQVYEVQTGSFYPMQKKIAHYLSETELTVTVVHPIPKNAWVSRIDAVTSEISPRHRSPKHGRAIDLLPELYYLAPHLRHPRLKFRLLLLEVQDFRLVDPSARRRKRSGERFERIPLSLYEDITFSSPADFAIFLPDELPQVFTVSQFSAATRLRGRDAYSAVRALVALGLLSPAPPIGRAMAFARG